MRKDSAMSYFESPKDKLFFKTSNLKHHFKQIEQIIEIESQKQNGDSVRLTAQFYNLEIEAFRKSMSLDFETEVDSKCVPIAPAFQVACQN